MLDVAYYYSRKRMKQQVHFAVEKCSLPSFAMIFISLALQMHYTCFFLFTHVKSCMCKFVFCKICLLICLWVPFLEPLFPWTYEWYLCTYSHRPVESEYEFHQSLISCVTRWPCDCRLTHLAHRFSKGVLCNEWHSQMHMQMKMQISQWNSKNNKKEQVLWNKFWRTSASVCLSVQVQLQNWF